MVPVGRASVSRVSAKKNPLRKSNKKVLQCQRISRLAAEAWRKCDCEMKVWEKAKSLGNGALQKLAERLTQRLEFGEIVGKEIGTRAGGIGTLAADLNDAEHFSVGDDGCAHDFLNGFGRVAGKFHAFEDGSVAGDGEIILDVGAIVSRCTSGERGVAGERNKADFFQRLRHQEMKVAPARGKSEDGNLVLAHAQALSDFFSNRSERDLRGDIGIGAQCADDAFQFGDEAERRAHFRMVSKRDASRKEQELANPVRLETIVPPMTVPRQEVFKSFVLTEKPVQLASANARAYTDCAATP
jgi:hypothetical protein